MVLSSTVLEQQYSSIVVWSGFMSLLDALPLSFFMLLVDIFCCAGDGHVDSDEFGRLYMKLFPHSSADTVNRAFQTLDIEGQGRVDIITWVNRIHLQDMPAMVDRVKRHGRWVAVGLGISAVTGCLALLLGTVAVCLMPSTLMHTVMLHGLWQ